MDYLGKSESCRTLAAADTPAAGTSALHTVASLACPTTLQMSVLAMTPDAFIDLQTPTKEA
jgi:hypothetical protein